MKIESGLQKYDDFFLKAKRIIVKVRIATKSVKALKEQPDFMLKNQELVPLLRSELGSLMTEAGEVGQEGTGLLNSVQSDFSGMNALKACYFKPTHEHIQRISGGRERNQGFA